jgi:tungstate transport system ATP-binding protein
MTPPPATTLFQIEGLRHCYGTRLVLDIPSLRITRGETLGIVGPSGAGKSTLLRILQFVEPATEGRLLFDGTAVSYPVPLQTLRRVTTVFQRPVMLDRSVRENVLFGLRLRGRGDDATAGAMLDRVGLGHLAGTSARTLSGGEIQRVALARALALSPDVLLLDEPAANLDPANVALVEALIRDEQRRGTTLILVTHNTHEARRLAQRTLLLLDGRPIEEGPSEAFFHAPADPRTRAFLAGDLVY